MIKIAKRISLKAISITSAAVFILLAGPTEAATLNFYLNAGEASLDENNAAVASDKVMGSVEHDRLEHLINPDRTNFNSASARAEFGSLGVEAIARYSNGSSPTGQNLAKANATARSFDNVDIYETTSGGLGNMIMNGIVRLEFELEGGLSLDGPFDTFSFGESAHIQFRVFSRGSTYIYYVRKLDYDGLTESGSLVADIPIINGSIQPQILFFAEATCGSATGSRNIDCDATASFLNSVTLLSGTVFDLNGDEILNAALISESGFGYAEGFGGTVSSVPIPPSILLFGAALGSLGFILKRRKRIIHHV